MTISAYNYFKIPAYIAGVNVQKGKGFEHSIAIVLIDGTPEEFARILGDLVYYELEDGYYMLVDSAYSDAFGYLSKGVEDGQFILHTIYRLEEVV